MPLELPPDLEEQPLDVIEGLLRAAVVAAQQEQVSMSETLRDQIYKLRDAYNECLGDDDGDAALFQACHSVLGTHPQPEVRCRPFSKNGRPLRCGENGMLLRPQR